MIFSAIKIKIKIRKIQKTLIKTLTVLLVRNGDPVRRGGADAVLATPFSTASSLWVSRTPQEAVHVRSGFVPGRTGKEDTKIPKKIRPKVKRLCGTVCLG